MVCDDRSGVNIFSTKHSILPTTRISGLKLLKPTRWKHWQNKDTERGKIETDTVSESKKRKNNKERMKAAEGQ